jgi:3'-phosphoadenosine 5'-phosphosulfate sulfotransferase (PAPS reductase)/FAD synthetase
MKHVVSISGGKDSTAMLLMMIEKKMQIDQIIFCDIGKEFPEMYNHIEKLNKYINPLKIETIKMDFDYWFFEHVSKRGENKGLPGWGWPSGRVRWCTAEKVRQLKKHIYTKHGIKLKDVVCYVGIAADESKRAERDTKGQIIKYPLIEWGISEAQALKYCKSKGFDWDGIYDKFSRSSCFCCPWKRISEIKKIYTDYPAQWREMVRMDNHSRRPFKQRYSLTDLQTKFDKEIGEAA